MRPRKSIHVGTAGWSLSSLYTDRFSGEGSHLERYAGVMNAVEINSSFYRPHRRATYERWAASVSVGFRFSVKAPKAVTHDQRLSNPDAILDRFTDEIAGLGKRLGVVLTQLPPSLPFEERAVAGYFTALSERTEASLVVEPRHVSWFTSDVEQWLVRRRIARVAADPAAAATGSEPGGWSGLAYWRLHGCPRMYYSAYGAPFLDQLAKAIRSAQAPVWCVFDNTAEGHAVNDALRLMENLKASRRRRSSPAQIARP